MSADWDALQTAIQDLVVRRTAASGTTQAELAALSGVSAGWLSRIKTRDGKPSDSVIVRICTALGEDPDPFLELAHRARGIRPVARAAPAPDDTHELVTVASDVTLHLDAVPAYFEETREVQATAPGVDRMLVSHVTWPKDNDKPAPRLVFTALEGATLGSVEAASDGYASIYAIFPRPVPLGRPHRFRIHADMIGEMKQVLVVTAIRPQLSLRMRIQFSTSNRPQAIKRVDGDVSALAQIWRDDREDLEVDSNHLVEVPEFSNLSLYHSYGAIWR